MDTMRAVLNPTAYGRATLQSLAAQYQLQTIAQRAGALWLPGMELPSGIEDALIAMSGFSTYAARALLNHLFRSASFSKLTNVYIALHASDPTDAGLTATEVSIGVNGYARAALAVSDLSWTAPATVGATEQITNAGNVTYSTPVGGDWNSGNPITWAAIWDAASASNMLASGALGTPRTVLLLDNAPVFGAGSLVMSLA